MGVEKPSLNEDIEENQPTQTEYTEFDPDAARQLVEETERTKKKRAVGAKVLVAAGFNSRHQEIVNSSFEKARKAKQKLVGNNGERRSDAYVTRVEEIVDKHGAKAERRLWDITSASEELVVKAENVPDSYWEAQAQIKRDNGLDEHISDYEKEILVEDAQKRQRESIKCWSDYFSQEDCPYPMWFKMFAWDGATKMSAVYDKDSQRFAKRDETTMAPYPHLNPAVLAQTYEAICRVNGLDEGEEMEESSLDEATEKVIKTYNFNKLYSLFLSRQKVAPEVPKNPEDVRGDWVEYRPGEEKALAEAAVGTPWCVASPAVGKYYLTKGRYGTDEVEETDSKAKFILFHLRDEDTGELASSACASIRLGTDGNVAEISGVREGQVLDDALVPAVEEKVKTLPGGKKFLEAFADKRALIELDKKMKAGEDFTDDELKFIYELDRPIHKLEQYGEDIRVAEAKQKYPVSVLIDRKLTNVRDLKQLMKKEQVEDVTPFMDAGLSIKSIIKEGVSDVQDVDELLKRDVPHKDIIDIFEQHGRWLFENFDYLASRGFTATEVTKRMSAATLLGHLDFLDENNIPYNLRRMMREAIRKYDSGDILDNSEAIIARGGKINFEKIARKMSPGEIIDHAGPFCDNGRKGIVEKAIGKLKDMEESSSYQNVISRNLRVLLDGEIEIADLEKIVNSQSRDTEQVLLNLDRLLDKGIEVKIDTPELIRALNGGKEGIFEAVIKHPEIFDLKAVYENMPKWAVVKYFDELIENGIEIDVAQLAKEAGADDRLLLKEKFEKHGVDIDVDSEISKLSSGEAFYLLDYHLDDENTTIVRENVDKIAAVVLSDIDNNKQLKNLAKPLLWRLGYIQ